MTDTREIAVQPRQSDNLLAQVIAAAKDPQIDAAKMETLARLVNTQQDREREIEFNMAKNSAITEMPVITKDGRIVIKGKDGQRDREQGRFARFEDIDRVVRPILARHNLAISFDVGSENGAVTVRPILSHANGFTQRGEAMRLPPDQSGGKQPVQTIGSSIAYGKRYAECAMLNIITEGVDDDGNGGREVAASLPFEREQVVRADATAAGEAGHYADWFSKQPPKDRSWLVTSDLHAKYGGQVTLPPPKKPDPVVIDETPEKKPEPKSEPTGEKRRTTPREWVDGFKYAADEITTLPELDEFEDRHRESMGKLKAADHTLWKEADDHVLKRREDIENGRLV